MHVSDRYLLPQVIPACVTGAGRPSSSQCHRRHTLAPLRSSQTTPTTTSVSSSSAGAYIFQGSPHTAHHTTPHLKNHTNFEPVNFDIQGHHQPTPYEDQKNRHGNRHIETSARCLQTPNPKFQGQNSKCEPQVRSLGGMERERYCTKSHVGWLDATAARRGVSHDGEWHVRVGGSER